MALPMPETKNRDHFYRRVANLEKNVTKRVFRGSRSDYYSITWRGVFLVYNNNAVLGRKKLHGLIITISHGGGDLKKWYE